MTRIYDALRKAETHRDRRAMNPVPEAPPSPEPMAAWEQSAPEAGALVPPLLGGVELSDAAAADHHAAWPSTRLDRVTRAVMFTSAQTAGTSAVSLQFAQCSR
jgi:hypothetical protein